MEVVQKVCPSLVLSGIILSAAPLAVQGEIPAAINPDFPMLTQAVPEQGGLLTADALLKKVQVAYDASGSAQFKLDTPRRWSPGENLIATLPVGWEVGFQSRQENVQITEFVPQGQTVHNWQSFFAMHVIFGGLSASPKQFFEQMTAQAKTICPGVDVSSVLTGEEKGYPFALWVQVCPHNTQVNQAEITLFKAVKGNDSFYLIHRAWRVATLSPGQSIPLDPAELERWGSYMRLVGVCDTRLPERNCPS